MWNLVSRLVLKQSGLRCEKHFVLKIVQRAFCSVAQILSMLYAVSRKYWSLKAFGTAQHSKSGEAVKTHDAFMYTVTAKQVN